MSKQEVVEEHGFAIEPRMNIPAHRCGGEHKGKFILRDLADNSEESYTLVGDDKEELAQACIESFNIGEKDKSKQYNHAFDIAFAVVTYEPRGYPTPKNVRGELQRILDDITDDELMEKIGAPFDSYEVL